MAPSRTRSLSNVLVALLLVATVWTAYVATSATATHMPADKAAAAASNREVFGPGARELVLSELMKVSSPSELILQLTAECSILTALSTDQDGVAESAVGNIEMWIEIDGTPVPVSTFDSDPNQEGVQTDNGQVTFCNRDYTRRITDTEDNTPPDGIDREDDYIRTRSANAFNWMAFDTGVVYDDSVIVNGNNILQIDVYATLTETASCNNDAEPLGETCADAIVGQRTLIIEPTKASIHEQSTEEDTDSVPPGKKN